MDRSAEPEKVFVWSHPRPDSGKIIIASLKRGILSWLLAYLTVRALVNENVLVAVGRRQRSPLLHKCCRVFMATLSTQAESHDCGPSPRRTPDRGPGQAPRARRRQEPGFRLSPENAQTGLSPSLLNAVIPVKTGIQGLWIPAYAGMTEKSATAALSCSVVTTRSWALAGTTEVACKYSTEFIN